MNANTHAQKALHVIKLLICYDISKYLLKFFAIGDL